jgi:hypothetical protein
MIKEVTSVLLIEYVTFSGPSNPCHFFNFINQSPYLKFIETQLFFSDQFLTPVFLSSISYHNTLTHLNLELLNKVCMKTIVYLIKCVPQICHLKLIVKSNGDPELAVPIFWEILLSKYLVKLKRISLNALVVNKNIPINPIWNFLIDKEKIFKRIEKSNYWPSHQWKTTFDSGIPILQYYYSAKFEVV